MRRQGPDQIQVEPNLSASTPRRGLRRIVPMLALVIGSALLLAGCGSDQPYSSISPRTEKASDIQLLYEITFWGALVVFIGVQAAIVYTVLRFRRRPNDSRPEQVHGSKRLEIAWTVIPAVVLLVIFVPTAQVIYDHAAAEDDANFVVDVYGKQWWWEFHYPDIPGAAEGEPLITANEVRIPEGANVRFNLRSNNVIHSFWVPQLSGKMDVIPGHDNTLQFEATRSGEYFGECAEFCGAAHAWMRFKVIVEPEENFDAWVAAWQEPPPVEDANPETADVVDAPAAFATCIACHKVTGTNAQAAGEGLDAYPLQGGPGPNLTLLGCRDTIAAGLLKNTEENLRLWLTNTDDVKEGTYMPNYVESGALTLDQVDEIVAYLMQLEPAGGCPPEQPVGGSIAVGEVAEE